MDYIRSVTKIAREIAMIVLGELSERAWRTLQSASRGEGKHCQQTLFDD